MATLAARLQQAVNTHAGHELANTDSTWRAGAELSAVYDTLRAELRAAINNGRNATRAEAVVLAHEFNEHKVVCDDAWRDIEQLLGELRQEAGNNCWKLDGPHLDGRFPVKQSPIGKPEIAAAR